MDLTRAALVIGFGSIGRRHARALARRVERLAIVDREEAARSRAKAEHPAARVASSLDELARGDWIWASTLAVIATWGPSHAELFERLVGLGVRRVVCEKPLADSVRRGADIVALARSLNVAVAVNHVGRYMGRAEGIEALVRAHGLGPVELFVAHGGAAGLVTNGIHFIDFACQLFKAEPQRVISTARADAVNPRSPLLRFYGGSATWTFPGGREAVLAFSNRSSLYPKVHLYHRHSVTEVDVAASTVTIYERDPDEVKSLSAITRTGRPGRVVYSGPIPGALTQIDEALPRLYDDILSRGGVVSPPEAGLTALSACIGALAAGESGTPVPLPIDPDSELGRRQWPIS